MPSAIYLAIGIMIIFGSLGGLVNYFRHNEEKSEIKTPIIKPILTGIIGAIIIPLILQMISNDTLKWMDAAGFSSIDPKLFLIFIAFCTIGGVAGETLLKAVSDKLIKMIDEAKAQAKNAQKRIDNLEEIMVEPEKVKVETNEKILQTDQPLNEEEQKILESLKTSKFRLRSVSGIANQTDFDSGTINNLLKQMEKKGVVSSFKGKDGNSKWFTDIT